MSELEEFDIEGEADAGDGHPRRHRRGIYLLPSIFTVASMLCGYYAIWIAFKGGAADLDNAAKAIGFAIVFDMLDGFVARITHTGTDLGEQFDSLADVISFGIAPALLAFVWGVNGLLATPGAGSMQVYRFGWLVGFAYLICCAWRLARFNIQGMAPERSRYFVGLPAPASAGLIAATVHAFREPITQWWLSLIWLCVVLLLGFLMASDLRYLGFKEIQWERRRSSLIFILIGLVIAAIVLYSQVALLTIASFYMLTGVTGRIYRLMRGRLASHPTNANS
jgi:CDP-diacylglycerol--serine O-phosphatidyltransferase